MGSSRPREEDDLSSSNPGEAGDVGPPPTKMMKPSAEESTDNQVVSNGVVDGGIKTETIKDPNCDDCGDLESDIPPVTIGFSYGHQESKKESVDEKEYVPRMASFQFRDPSELHIPVDDTPDFIKEASPDSGIDMEQFKITAEEREKLSPEEIEKLKEERRKEWVRQMDELNADKFKCGLCRRPRYFEKLYQLHDHLLEFHLIPNDEDAVNEYVIQPLRPPETPVYPSTKELLGEIEKEEVDPLIYEPQTFRPTYEEFKDLQGYVKYMESCGAHKAGIAKIVVPREWIPRKQGYNPSDFDITIPGPVQQNISCGEVDGAFKTIADRSIPPINIEKYMKLATGDKYLTPAHNSYEELEELYWKENLDDTKLAPIYGADVEESITDPEVDVWNIKKLNSLLVDVLDEQIPGVNTPYLYVGMWKATFSWHVEDMDLYAVNYIHYGAPKTWYGIPPSEGHKLEQLARKLFPDMAKTCFNLMRHKCLMISPKLLRANGVRVNKLVQEERNMIIAFPHAYHSGFNHGFNMAESTNFAVDRWVEYGKRFRDCLCRGNEDEVSIELEPFVAKLQPEKLEAYKEKKDFGLHPEDPWYVRRCWKDVETRFEKGQITENEFNNMKRHLKRKRQIPFWWKQKFDIDYYDDMRFYDLDMSDCIEEEKKEDQELDERLSEAKYQLKKRLGRSRDICDIKMKKIRKTVADIYMMDFRAYTEMREEMFEEERERKANVTRGFTSGNAGNALGHGQAKGVGFKNIDENDLLDKRSKVICRAKKNHRFKACSKCTGCKTPNCGECEHCLDMPKFGGMGTMKQKCMTRLCINPVLRTCDQCEWVI